jgi:hypothetical protein
MKYLKIGICLICAITMIYDSQGHPDYEAINRQFEEKGE